jgi:8-amino-3,8-dideoxy-alpha-D-manno-octulosonate transaminase
MPGFEVYDHLERDAVCSVFDEGNVLFSHGFHNVRKHFHVTEFNRQCENYFSAPHAISVSSGTAGLKCALKALNVGPGDEVITQGFNFIATIEAIVDIGAVPIICDLDHNLNLEPSTLCNFVTPNTKAVIVVHMLGEPADTFTLKSICADLDVPLIEDACESIGAKQSHQYCGTIGDLGVFSFDHGKMIAAGEGGMVLTSSARAAKFVTSYIDHGHNHDHLVPRGLDSAFCVGFNFRMTELQGALCKIQLGKLPFMLSENLLRYEQLLFSLNRRFYIRNSDRSGYTHTYDTLMLHVPDELTRSTVLQILNESGLGTKNVPDAIKWHCSYFWGHALSDMQIAQSQHTYKLLMEYVAIPISLKKSQEFYSNLGYNLSRA